MQHVRPEYGPYHSGHLEYAPFLGRQAVNARQQQALQCIRQVERSHRPRCAPLARFGFLYQHSLRNQGADKFPHVVRVAFGLVEDERARLRRQCFGADQPVNELAALGLGQWGNYHSCHSVGVLGLDAVT